MNGKGNWIFISLGISFGAIVLFMAGPLISLFIAGGIADLLGCVLPINSMAPCPILGIDVGDTLLVMAYAGYLGFFTVPAGMGLLAIWLAAACIVSLVWWIRRRRDAATGA